MRSFSITSLGRKAIGVALLATVAATAAPAFAQCAGCGADFNRADRDRTDREAKDRADRDRADHVRDHMGNGMLHDTADKVKEHNDRNDRALKGDD